MAPSDPRPSIHLHLAAIIVIAVTAYLASRLTAAIVVDLATAESYAYSVFWGVLLLFFSVLLIRQYLGVFRSNRNSALATGWWLYAIGGLFVLGTAEGILLVPRLMARDDYGKWRPLLVIAALLLVGPTLIVFGAMNRRWGKRLPIRWSERFPIRDAQQAAAQRGRFSLREIFGGMALVAAMCGVIQLHVGMPPTERFAVHVAADAAPLNLPAGASDVCYGLGYRGRCAYEFACDESAFRKWVDAGIGSIASNAAGVPVREISGPYAIASYQQFAPRAAPVGDIVVTNGLYYSWSEEDRYVSAVFDRDRQRAYYHSY